MKSLILTTIYYFLFIPLNWMSAQEIYVDNTYGGDSPSGTLSLPYKSIQRAVDKSQPGDIIFVKGGIYREQVQIGQDSIQIRNFPGEKVVINGTEPVIEWKKVQDEVYKAIVPWDITENDLSNQVFVDGEMIHLTRWPKETSREWVTDPNNGVIDAAENSGTGIIITDEAFDEPAERWLNSMVWVNLANDHDGQGWSGEISYISASTSKMKIIPVGAGIHAASGHDPWAVQRGSKYYLFNPTPVGVYATGGPSELLSRGEWWKNGDTLFIRMPNGKAPAASMEENNLVEVKKRVWAFIPEVSDFMHHVTIKGFHLFGASITTDKDFTRGNLAVNSHHNIIDSINARYLMHFIDQTGHYQSQWYGRSGIILSGEDNVLKNSIIKYSAASAVSAFGNRHVITGNSIYEVNYQVTEAGAINSGNSVKLYDPEISYNLFYNVPQKTINIGKMYSSDPSVFGLIRLHHNVIMNFMLRNSDSAAMNCSAGRSWQNIRIDHNVIAHTNTFLAIGIYTDYGGDALFHHNLIWDVDRPMQLNRYDADHPAPIGESDDGPIGEIYVYNNTLIADSWNKPAVINNHVNGSGEGMFYKNNIIANSIKASLELATMESNLFIDKNDAMNMFMDYEKDNFQLSSSATSAIDQGVDVGPYNDSIVNGVPDIGAFEYGAEPWKAGPEGIITDLKILVEMPDTVFQGDTIYFGATAYTNGIFIMDPQPTFHWSTGDEGKIDAQGMFIADSVTGNAKIYVTADSLIFASKTFKIMEKKETGNGSNHILNPSGDADLPFNLYPNPIDNELRIKLEKPVNNGLQISIFDMQGKEVYGTTEHALGISELTINMDHLKEGVYFVKIKTKEHEGTGKIIISR